MSAPEASCALTIMAGDEYLPVPTMSRDEKVLLEQEARVERPAEAVVGLGLAVDVEKANGRTLLVVCIKDADTLDFRGFGPIDSARSAALSAFAPVGDAATSVFRPVGNFWHGAFQYEHENVHSSMAHVRRGAGVS